MEHKAGLWYRNGALVYMVKHYGWSAGGKETFTNDVEIRVQGANAESLAEDLLDYLRTRESVHA